jgi:acyl dehydratase
VCPNSLPTEAIESDVVATFNAEQREWAIDECRTSLTSILIPLLNTYAGLATAIAGFVLDNTALVVAGMILVGSAVVLVNGAESTRRRAVRVISSIQDAVDAVGQELGVSQWAAVDQDRINAFADTTGDHQWIHVDVERAGSESPYGTTIAHGFLTLSLIPALSKDNYRVDNAKMGINYGLNKVRFLAPVPAGSRVRVRSDLLDAKKVNDSTVDLTVRQTVELDGSDKPAAVAEVIARMVF